ncbi:MAG TPA: hypothetical protein VN372_12350, partial [Methanospirillum sp.]|nr:hypothetical protein [Methanospirillum sp.]
DKKQRIIFLNQFAEQYLRVKRSDVIMEPLFNHLNIKVESNKTPMHVFNDIFVGSAIVGTKQYGEGKLPNGKRSNLMIQSAEIIDEEKMVIGEIVRII